MKDDTIKVIGCVAGLVLIECVALSEGIDGTVMAATVAAIAGLGGYSLAKLQNPANPP